MVWRQGVYASNNFGLQPDFEYIRVWSIRDFRSIETDLVFESIDSYFDFVTFFINFFMGPKKISVVFDFVLVMGFNSLGNPYLQSYLILQILPAFILEFIVFPYYPALDVPYFPISKFFTDLKRPKQISSREVPYGCENPTEDGYPSDGVRWRKCDGTLSCPWCAY